MECCRSVSKIAATAMLLAVLAVTVPAIAAERLVLIVSADSSIEQLDSLQVRKLFLGLTVTHGNDRLRPVLNETDSRIKEVFLQNIVSMSDITYDRSLLRLALIEGQTRPRAYKDITALMAVLAGDPNAVSYAWERDVARDPRIRVLRILWYD